MSREGFERFARQHYQSARFTRYEDGRYTTQYLAEAWTVWQAATQAIEPKSACGACDAAIELDAQEYCENCLLSRIGELEAQLANSIVTDNSAVIDGLQAKIKRVECELVFMRALSNDHDYTVAFRDGVDDCVVRIEQALRRGQS